MEHDARTISLSTSLQDFFHQSVQDVVEKHHIDGIDDTIWYLTQLLCTYARTNRFYDNRSDGARTPLADYYRQSLEAPTEQERRLHLQRLGDVAIFISSLFAGSLKRKPVNVSYYISMGESAYGTLADSPSQSSRDRALCDIFADLAARFPDYVAALSDIPAKSNEQTLLQRISEWEQTQHPGIARELREQGIFLDQTSGRQH